MHTEIQGSEKIVKFFGYWPDLCDGKIRRFAILKPKAGITSIEMEIGYIDSNQKKLAEIRFEFTDVSKVEIDNIYSENVLDKLEFSFGTSPRGPECKVCLIPCAGARGSFLCSGVAVNILSSSKY
jgi:hypothetical protein